MTFRKLAVSAGALAALGTAVTWGAAAWNERRAEAEHPPQGEFVEVDGARVHYLRVGTGPELVLIHGAGGNMRDFTFSFVDLVKDRFTVTAFDRPGLGYSDRVPGVDDGPFATEGESPLQQARHLKKAAAMLGIEAPVVLGASFGGIVAIAWAVDDLDTPSPQAADGLVMVGGVAMPWEGGLGPYYEVNASPLGAVTVPLLSAFAPQSRVDAAIEGTFRPQPAPEGYAEHIGAHLTLRREAFRANVRQVNGLKPHVIEMSERYPELTLPIEMVHGDADETVPLRTHGPFAEIAPGADLTVLPGIGHMPHHVAAAEVIAAIDRAVSRAK